MRPTVRAAFVGFSEPLEGIVYSIYADVKSLPTTGMGNLLTTPDTAAGLPFRRRDGSLATPDEKRAEWRDIRAGCCKAGEGGDDYRVCRWPEKKNPTTGAGCFAHRGWTASEAARPRLKLAHGDVVVLIHRELDRFWNILRQHFAEIDEWPADAQLGLLSMSWGLGPAFAPKWPRFTEAARSRDFLAAATECRMQGEGTIHKRNDRNKVLFRNASVVASGGHLPDRLWWPRDIFEEPLPLEDDTLDEDDATKRSAITWETVTRLPGSIANDDDEPPEAA